MIIAILFGAIVGLATHGTVHYDECKANEFKPNACVTSKTLHDAGNVSIKVEK